MRKNKKWLIALTASLAVLTCASAVMLREADSVSAKAEDLKVTAATTAEEGEFYMQDGASVYGAGGAGIRFTATITKAWWDTLDTTEGYTFYSTVTANGITETKEYNVTPVFTDGVYNLYSAVVYGNVSEEQKATAVALDFTAKTYLEVGGEVYAAYGNAGERSMQAVANTAWLTEKKANGEANPWYHSDALKAYFTEGARTEDVRGGFTADGKGTVTVPGLKATDVKVYVGADEVTATVTGEKITLSGVDVTGMKVGDEAYVSVFAGNTVYSSKAVYADTLLTAKNLSVLKTAEEGYFVLTEDIDMGTNATDGVTGTIWTAPESTFKGTLNGAGYTLKNMTPDTGGKGLFLEVDGATIKNLAYQTIKSRGANGLLAKNANGTVTVENVYFSVDINQSTPWGLFQTLNGTVNAKNMIVKFPSGTSEAFGYIAGRGKFGGGGIANVENCYFIGGNKLTIGTYEGYSGTVNGTPYIYTDTTEYTRALSEIEKSFTTQMKAFSDSYVKE